MTLEKSQTNTKGEYGTKLKYSKEKANVFPDFTLKYLGTRVIKAQPPYNRPINVEQFEVSGKKETKKIEWSAGTGDIGPPLFSMGDRHFKLELGISEHLDRQRQLAEGELVVWRHPITTAPISVRDIDQDPTRYHQQKVILQGSYEAGFEIAQLDGKVWVNFSPTVNKEELEALDWQKAKVVGFLHKDVIFTGVLESLPGQGYGHLGSGSYQITVTSIRILNQ